LQINITGNHGTENQGFPDHHMVLRLVGYYHDDGAMELYSGGGSYIVDCSLNTWSVEWLKTGLSNGFLTITKYEINKGVSPIIAPYKTYNVPCFITEYAGPLKLTSAEEC